MPSLPRNAATKPIRTNSISVTPRRPRLLRCGATKPFISTQSASRDVLISPATPTALCLLNKMGSGSSLSPSDTEEVVGGLLKQVVSYGEQSSPDATVNYETGCGSGSTVTGAYVSFPNFDNWSSTKPNHAFREADE